jgi:protein arginine N-methyltransferase 5
LIHNPDFLISWLDIVDDGMNIADISLDNTNLSYYREYINHLHSTLPGNALIDSFAQGYHDRLQSPLQPLMDNLEIATYNVFESDPIKYELYQEAVYQALVDRAIDPGSLTVIIVVGAGAHGPLVDRCLAASKASNRKVKLYAVEKNPNAIPTLLNKVKEVWGNVVQVHHVDMR